MSAQPKPFPLGLTDRGRLRAVTYSLEQRWPNLIREQQEEARQLIARLAALYRATPDIGQPVRVPLLGRVAG